MPTIIAITILILAIGIGVTAVSFSEVFVSAGQKQSAQALVYAEAGARDALMKIARNKNYFCVSEDCYSIDMIAGGCSGGDGCAKISVSSDVGDSGNPKRIISKGQSNSSIRRIQIDVIFDVFLNGEIATTTWKELVD